MSLSNASVAPLGQTIFCQVDAYALWKLKRQAIRFGCPIPLFA